MTPALARSERTIFWTPTDRATCRWSNPRCARYTIARSVNSEAKQRRTASRSMPSPWMLRYVSCCPAKLASGRSSAVALLRTATSQCGPYSSWRRPYAARTADAMSSGSVALRIAVRTRRPADCSRSICWTSSPVRASSIRGSRPASERKRRYASAVVAKPFGTRMPRGPSARRISPSDAFLPPTRGTSARSRSSNQRTHWSCVALVIAVSRPRVTRTEPCPCSEPRRGGCDVPW